MAKISYDEKCQELAEYFLHPDSDADSIASLAARIQQTVEDFIEENHGKQGS